MIRPFLLSLLLFSFASAAPVAVPQSASDLLHELRAFAQTGRVLYVAAHPDDENTRLITYLARGRGYQTGYLSLTRGDGGQNLIGTELGAELGVIRTQELLAARRIDGGVQFFTRANDFGFSKSAEETLAVWDRAAVVADMVRVIRSFRPDVIITRFSPEPGGTHGHHTASAQLALEAFRLAADPAAFANELGDLDPWQPKRVWWNAWAGRGTPISGNPLALDIGGFDPLLGESFGEIAARSRTMHKSQGFGALGSRGAALDYFRLLAGEPAEQDIMEGVDTSWRRIPQGAAIGEKAQTIIAAFNPLRPDESVPALLALRAQLHALPAHALVREKQDQLDRILAGCLGLHVLTTTAEAEAVPGEQLALRHTAIVRNRTSVRWVGVAVGTGASTASPNLTLEPNRAATAEMEITLPPDTPISTPYWLRQPGTAAMYAVEDPELIGRPEAPPVVPVEYRFEIGGQQLSFVTQPYQVQNDPVRGEQRHPLRIVPPVSLAFAQSLELLTPGTRRAVVVEVTAARGSANGHVQLTVPPGWQVTPARQSFDLAGAGARERVTFELSAPAEETTGRVLASATVGEATQGFGRREIRYEHIPSQLLQPRADLKVVSATVRTRGERIGYLAGAGDLVADALLRMGYLVTPLGVEDLTQDGLRRFDAVVLGVRALNTLPQIDARMPALFAYAAAGGTVVVQYNTSHELKTRAVAPYPLRLSRDRVTEEDAAVRLLAPDHPALQTPNRISTADFAGWVQERGLYFPDQWDQRFTPLLSAADTGEPPRDGALLVARHGDGWFVYTGLSFFRQLPEGVPGAYRLWANLVSLSHAPPRTSDLAATTTRD